MAEIVDLILSQNLESFRSRTQTMEFFFFTSEDMGSLELSGCTESSNELQGSIRVGNCLPSE
jgi:hypothetical protein